MKSIMFIVCLAFVISCGKERITSYYAYIKNSTNHQIEIKPYSNGSVVTTKIISLAANQEKQIADGFDRGIVGNVGFNSDLFSGVDSIRVYFDNSYSITHYFITPAVLNPKHYLYSSLRNLGNYLSYEYFAEDVTKYARKNTYIYRFIEQDYLDAK